MSFGVGILNVSGASSVIGLSVGAPVAERSNYRRNKLYTGQCKHTKLYVSNIDVAVV